MFVRVATGRRPCATVRGMRSAISLIRILAATGHLRWARRVARETEVALLAGRAPETLRLWCLLRAEVIALALPLVPARLRRARPANGNFLPKVSKEG